MLEKNYKDYIPEIGKRLRNDSPVHGHKVSDREIEKVLIYFHKNLKQTLNTGLHVFLDPYLWFVNKAHKPFEKKKKKKFYNYDKYKKPA